MLLKISGPPSRPRSAPRLTRFNKRRLNFFSFHLRREGECIHRTHVVLMTPPPSTYIPLFFHSASLRPLSLPFFAECPVQLASTFSLFASGIVPCMSSVAIRRKGLDERCLSRPRPPSPLNGDNRAVLYVQMTTHKYTHIHTLPGNCSSEGLCATHTFRVYYITKLQLLSLLVRTTAVVKKLLLEFELTSRRGQQDKVTTEYEGRCRGRGEQGAVCLAE